jgi:APA family basic amino acid/polyamine antiporter
VVALVLSVDLRGAVGFSSFAVLTYYGIANAAAWTLARDQRRWPRPVAGLGLAGCALLAFTLPTRSVATGVAVIGLGALVWWVGPRRRARLA